MNDDLHIVLLGGFRLTYKDEPVSSVNTNRIQSLLTYLLLNRESAQPRQRLAFLFWPESTEKQALNNLRQQLFQLRKVLPKADHFLRINSQTLQWNTSAQFYADVIGFEQCCAKAQKEKQKGNAPMQESALAKAIELYKGKLLISCYDDWIVPERERLHQKYVDALSSIIHLLERNRDYSTAKTYAKKLLQSDPLNESTYRAIMRLYSLSGDKAKAIQTYKQCKAILNEELGIRPSSETETLFQRIRASEPVALKGKPSDKYYSAIQGWPLIGRAKEWDTLLGTWKKTLKGQVQAVFISGDPGIGKTRLAYELLQFISRQGYITGYTKSYEAAGRLSYGAVTDWLREGLLNEQLHHLEPVWQQELVRLLPELLSRNEQLRYPDPIKEPWQQKHFLEAITRGVLGNKKPRLLLLDDLQWCDSETLAWLEHLFHFDPNAKLLLVGMLRPAEATANKALKTLTNYLRKENVLIELPIKELSISQTNELVTQISSHAFDEALLSHIYQETEGNPLFIIESIREGMDRGMKKNTSQGIRKASYIPTKVKEVISARFEDLSKDSRQLMELAATIGREFNFKLLATAFGKGEATVVDLIEELLEQHIIRELREETYDFTHDKIREVAYMTMSGTRKRFFNMKVAESMKEVYSQELDQYYSRLAFHYDRSGNAREAITYYDKAARSARNIFAYDESINHLKRALELLKQLPNGGDKDRLECVLQTDLSLSLIPITGYSGKGVLKSCNRILALYKDLGETPAAPVIRMLAIGNIAITRFDEAIELGYQLQRHAKKTDDVVELVESDYVLGSANHWKGNFEKATIFFREGVEKYDPVLQEEHIQRYGQNPMLVCKVRLALLLWMFGDIENAEKYELEVMKEAKAMNHPFSLAYIVCWCCWIQLLKGNFAQSAEIGKQYFIEPIDGEYITCQAHIKAIYGSALFKTGQKEQGIALIREAINIHNKINVRFITPYLLCLLAEALANYGEFEKVFPLLKTAFEKIENSGERWLASELYRIKGDIYCKANPQEITKAKNCYRKGLEVARSQGAVAFVQKLKASLENLKLDT